MIRLVFALLVASGVLVGVGAGPAFGCDCASGSVKNFVGYADVIVTGTLTEMDDPPQQEVVSSMDPITYTVDVDQTFKGDVAPQVVFTSAMSGASCGLENMQADRRYAFFLNTAGDGLDANLCGGTAPTSQQLEKLIARWTGPPDTLPASAAPAAAPAETTPSDRSTSGSSASLPWIVGGAVLLAGVGILLWAHRSRQRR